MCTIWIRAPSSAETNRTWCENTVFVFLINVLILQKPLDTLHCCCLSPPPLLKGAHYLAYFHSRQQRKMFIMLSCVIHREQLCMCKHILSRMPVFSLKKCRRFNCISAVSLLSEWTKDGCSGTSPRAIFMNTFWWRLTNLCYRVAFF